MKVQVLSAVLALCITLSCSECIDGICDTFDEFPSTLPNDNSPPTNPNIPDFTPEQEKLLESNEEDIRSIYWYFLTGGELLSTTITDSDNGVYYFFRIYQSGYGTFQVVSVVDKLDFSNHQILSFVRLSNGHSADDDGP